MALPLIRAPLPVMQAQGIEELGGLEVQQSPSGAELQATSVWPSDPTARLAGVLEPLAATNEPFADRTEHGIATLPAFVTQHSPVEAVEQATSI
jgi:hypothetical protein